jgi:hypothetical protein
LNALGNKRVRDEKLLEFKKQILSNKSLKEYFKHNPSEKEILQNDIKKNSFNDKILFMGLETLPFYTIPSSIIATTPEEIGMCTTGSGQYVPDWLPNPTQSVMSKDNLIKNKIGGSFNLVFVDADEAQTSSLILSMVNFPVAAEKFRQSGQSFGTEDTGEQEAAQTFAYEHPSLVSYEALEPTSGRKAWMIRHGKRIKKKLKADNKGYIGS